MSHDPKPTTATVQSDAPASPSSQPAPRYQKPVLRRYDQIEQVRPYGPSEV
jgi:hypothetical protein